MPRAASTRMPGAGRKADQTRTAEGPFGASSAYIEGAALRSLVLSLQSLLTAGQPPAKAAFSYATWPPPVPGKAHPSRGRAACPGFRYARFIRQHMPQARSAQARLLAACSSHSCARETRHAPDPRMAWHRQTRRSSDCARDGRSQRRWQLVRGAWAQSRQAGRGRARAAWARAWA